MLFNFSGKKDFFKELRVRCVIFAAKFIISEKFFVSNDFVSESMFWPFASFSALFWTSCRDTPELILCLFLTLALATVLPAGVLDQTTQIVNTTAQRALRSKKFNPD